MSGFSLGTKWDKISENDYKIAPKGPMWHWLYFSIVAPCGPHPVTPGGVPPRVGYR
jgi:hypothetical protein